MSGVTKLGTLTVLLGLCFATAVFGATIHVPIDCNTIEEAVGNCQNGDSIIVTGGEYERFSIRGKERITLIGIPVNDQMPIIYGLPGTHTEVAVYVEDCSFIEIAGFEITRGYTAIWLVRSSQIIIRENYIHDLPDWWSSSISFTQASDIEIFNNVMIRSWHYGVYLNFGTRNVRVYNNLIGWHSCNDGVHIDNASEIRVFNNIIIGNHDVGVYVTQNANDVIVDYNCIYNNRGGDAEGFNQNHNVYENPLIENLNRMQYDLNPESPCIDAGDPTGPPDPDGSLPDIGLRWDLQPIPPLTVELLHPTGGEQFSSGEVIDVNWTAEGGAGINHSILSYSLDNGENWLEVGTTEGNDFSYPWQIPDILGDYLLKLVVFDNGEETATDQSELFSVIPMTLSQWVAPGWSLISIPLTQPNMHKDAVFGDDLEFPWAIYGYNPAQGHTVPDTLRAGEGYFVASLSGGNLDVTGTANTNETHTVNLRRSWNVFGNPFCGQTALVESTVKMWDRDGEHTYTFNDAVDEKIVSPVAFNYLDDRLPGDDLWPHLNGFQSSDTLQNWRGYWYMCYKDSVQLILKNPNINEAPRRDYDEVFTAENWYLDLVAASEFAGDNARIGTNEKATMEFNNRFDYVEPPRRDVKEWIRIYFEHSEWNNPNATRFTRDIRAPLAPGETQDWNLTIESNPDVEVYLLWSELSKTAPKFYSFTLIDLENGNEVNLHDDSVYKFQSNGSKQLVIRVKSDEVFVKDGMELPSGFSISSPYPNPFNSKSNVQWSIPERGDVTLSLHEISGRLVRILNQGTYSAGTHSTTIVADNLPSGLYMVRLSSGSELVTRKLLLVR